MKSTCALLVVLLLFVCTSAVQYAPAQSAARTDVYNVHFAKATLGKGAEEGDFLKQQSPDAPMKGHYLVLAASEWGGLGLRGYRTSGNKCYGEGGANARTGERT